jgi:hypothetical protein
MNVLAPLGHNSVENRVHDVISQKTELFVTILARFSDFER